MTKKKPENCLSCRNVVHIEGLDRYECGLRKRTQWNPESDSCGRFERRRCSVKMKIMTSKEYFEREIEAKKHRCGDCDHLIWDREEDFWRCVIHHMPMNEGDSGCIHFREKKCLAEKRRKEEDAAFLENSVYGNIQAAVVNIETALNTVDEKVLKSELKKTLDNLNRLRRRIKKMIGG